jgi:hypothetical protein
MPIKGGLHALPQPRTGARSSALAIRSNKNVELGTIAVSEVELDHACGSGNDGRDGREQCRESRWCPSSAMVPSLEPIVFLVTYNQANDVGRIISYRHEGGFGDD